MEYVEILSRWIHVGTAIVLLGGSVFTRFVLMPVAATLPDDAHTLLREGVAARWRKFVGIGIGLLLLSGLYNYVVVSVPKHRGDGLYHGLMGAKMLLSLGVFFLASALTGRASAFESLRSNSRRWLGLLILLTALVVAIAGFLKIAAKPTTAEPADNDSAAVTLPASPCDIAGVRIAPSPRYSA